MGKQSFDQVTIQWIKDHQWPPDKPQSYLVVCEAPGEWFFFRSAFDYLEVRAKFDKFHNRLDDVQVLFSIPGKAAATLLVRASSYNLSTRGKSLDIDLGDGYIKGSISFFHGPQNRMRNIFATYDLAVPFSKEGLKGTVNIAPGTVSEANSLSIEEPFKGSNLSEGEDEPQQALLVKYLKDFVVDGNFVTQTWYPSGYGPISASTQWKGSVTFRDIYTLVGSVDPETLMISAALYIYVPFLGQVWLSKIRAYLTQDGASTKISSLFAEGNMTFKTEKTDSGKLDVYVKQTLSSKFELRNLPNKDTYHLFTLPEFKRE